MTSKPVESTSNVCPSHRTRATSNDRHNAIPGDSFFLDRIQGIVSGAKKTQSKVCFEPLAGKLAGTAAESWSSPYCTRSRLAPARIELASNTTVLPVHKCLCFYHQWCAVRTVPCSTCSPMHYDARSGQFWRGGSSRTRDRRYEGRVALNVTSPHRVALSLHRVTRNDTGKFTCRVDFLGSPSLNSAITLKVYENPIHGPNITLWQHGVGRSTEDIIQGPFHEGDIVNLTCTVVGGFPQPVVTWWQGNTLVDNISHVEPGSQAVEGRRVVNLLTLGPLTRALVSEPFICRSENNPLSKPRYDTVHLKIYSEYINE
ncbi:Immunoglobulin-like domain [Trinorchestia longiramus]|nr:Immunoglobulin-like domain [Trinorchestia longiramus]